MPKINANPLKAQLKILLDRHKKITTNIECLQYEARSIEQAMTPLKEVHDQLIKITGKDLTDSPPPQGQAAQRQAPQKARVQQNVPQLPPRLHRPMGRAAGL